MGNGIAKGNGRTSLLRERLTRSLGLRTTLYDQYERTGRRSSGFDYLRLWLALVIAAYHAFFVTAGWSTADWALGGPLRPLTFFLVPSFFALSGFLIAGSLERNPLPSFLALRALRIVPALAVEVFISALVIGPLLTDWSWADYFKAHTFWHYFMNIAGKVHQQLPGVFLHNPLAENVNGQLWTVPYEFDCYFILAGLALLGIALRSFWVFFLAFALSAYLAAQQMLGDAPRKLLTLAPGLMLIASCFFGVWLYAARRRVPHSWPLFLAALAATWAMLSTVDLAYLAALPLAYVTIFIGLLDPPRLWIVGSGDYSYGLYLYGWPIQQSLVQLLPAHGWAVNFAAALAVAGGCAFLSWHFVESRVLARRKNVLGVVSAVAARLDRARRRMRIALLRLFPLRQREAYFAISILFPSSGRRSPPPR